MKPKLKRNITITLGALFVLLLILLRLGWGEFFLWQFDLARSWELRVQADIPPYSVELVQEPGFDFYNSYFLIKRGDGKTAFVLIDGDDSKWRKPKVVHQDGKTYFVRGAGKIAAIDLSPGMIEQLQQRIAEAGLENITARCLDIFTDPPDEQYDLIFSAMAMHHVPDTDALLNCFAELLVPGGWIALADLDSEDGTFHDGSEGFVHHGFDRDELMQKLRDRRLVETASVTAHIMQKPSGSYPVFLITARKPV